MMCDTRCGHATAQKTVRTVRWVCPKSRGQLQALEVNAGRIESFEGAPASYHGPGDRRGVTVDADDDDADDDDVDLEL